MKVVVVQKKKELLLSFIAIPLKGHSKVSFEDFL